MNAYLERLRSRVDGAVASRWAMARAETRRWHGDRSGATLVQFIVVLPVFIMVVIGMYGVFTVMSSRDMLCQAAWEASRYLQVEGPFFPDNDPAYNYPDGWESIARQIVDQQLASRTYTLLYPVDKVDITPDIIRTSPKDSLAVSPAEVDNGRFEIQVSKAITNPMGVMLGVDPGLEKINLTCKVGGFYEGPPVGPTDTGRGQAGCPRVSVQCPPNRGETNTPTPRRGDPTQCPVCATARP